MQVGEKPCAFGLTFRPEENSTISSAWTFLSPYTLAIPSPIDSTRPVSSRSAEVSAPRIFSSRMEDTSAVPVKDKMSKNKYNWMLK